MRYDTLLAELHKWLLSQADNQAFLLSMPRAFSILRDFREHVDDRPGTRPTTRLWGISRVLAA